MAGDGGGAGMLSLLSLLSPKFENVREVSGGLSIDDGRTNAHERRLVLSSVPVVEIVSAALFCRDFFMLLLKNGGVSVGKRLDFSAKVLGRGVLGLSFFSLASSVFS